ncbi:MAG TPA: ABC transporter ATP-binding protein, partial [Candidatus Mediterraneibacter merdavium]|nr:ABC transporter ATP-binding protein [Candidatus Mediterraneibacter merdavium]
KIYEGEIVALIGKNGAGKTTLLNAICDYIRPTSGSIYFKGKNLQEEKELLKKVGILIEPSFFDYLTAEENLQYLAVLAGRDKHDKRISDLLKKTELYKSRRKKVREFSFGMKQRLGLCQSLLAEVDMLVFDEPFVGLDPIGKELFKQVIIEMAHDKRVPVLFSSHDLDDVDEICDRVVMIQNGVKVLDQKISKTKTFILRVDHQVSELLKRKLEETSPSITCNNEAVFFKNEEHIIDIQKKLLEEGYYIVGLSIENNNLKKLFLGETKV